MKKAVGVTIFLLILAAVLLALYLWHGGPEGPNLLLITLDTTRADHLGCYGYADATTPALDALARSGVRFTRARCNVPLTLPSHATILTGLYPPEHGLRVNGEKTLAKEVTTLAEVFASHGYQTAAFIAAFVLDTKFGLGRGFQTYDQYEIPDAGDIVDDSMMYRYRQGDQVAQAALSWLREHSRRPFFCWVHFFDPHRPYYPHPEFDRHYPDSPYDSEVAFMDLQVNRLIDLLQKENLIGKTFIIALGDHGEGLGEHGEVEHGLLLYDSVMRVPLIVSAPGRIPAGQEVAVPVSTIDLFPTILDLFGWEPSGHISGRSFGPALLGGSIPARPIYGETEFPLTEYGWSPLKSLTTEEWKYIQAPREELYALLEDPEELEDLFPEDPEVASEMKGKLSSVEKEMVIGKASEVKMDDLSRDILASLGYLGGGEKPASEAGALRDPKDVIELRTEFVRAAGDIKMGKTAEAEATLRKLIKESPETRAFRSTLARMLYEQGDYEKACGEFRQVAALYPDEYGAHYNLGKALIKLGLYDEAIKELRLALEIDPEETWGFNNLGIAQLRTGRIAEAMEVFRKSISINPDQCDPHNNLGNAFLALGRLDEAGKEFQRAINVDADFFEGHFNLGLVELQLGHYNEAAQEFREALRLRPGFGPAREKLALALEKRGSRLESKP